MFSGNLPTLRRLGKGYRSRKAIHNLRKVPLFGDLFPESQQLGNLFFRTPFGVDA